MLEQILNHLHNWFVIDGGIHEGEFEIKADGIELPFLVPGQYFRICGSVFNDGLHRYPADDLRPETFSGTIWALSIPRDVIQLAKEIETWQSNNGDAAASPYQSESFGGYTYQKATDAKTGGAMTWQAAFRTVLNQWRKIR